jgi:transposase
VGNGTGEDLGATALVGLDGFVVKSMVMRDGEHWLLIETTAARAWCVGCGVRAVGNGRRRVTVRDLPIAGVATVIVWAKRTWRCLEERCERSSWSETSTEIGVRASLTERARREICRRVGEDLDTVAEVGPASSGSAGRAPIKPSSTTATR